MILRLKFRALSTCLSTVTEDSCPWHMPLQITVWIPGITLWYLINHP
jgi:hypothetical protein